uniref:Uncharacterized protein n=1 Tax=Oryza brachyantha TaxID=4533 RepID=J3LHF2_ORYBR
MLRRSSSMFIDPKSFPTPPSVLWNSSNVSEYTDPCLASGSGVIGGSCCCCGLPLPPGKSISKLQASNQTKTPPKIRDDQQRPD